MTPPDDTPITESTELNGTDPTIEILDRLDLSLAKIGQELPALATGLVVAVREQSRRTRRLVWLLLAVAVVLGGIAFSNYRLSTERAQVGDSIADCTTPGGECYTRNQENLKAAIAAVAAEQQADSRAVVDQAVCEMTGETREVCQARFPIPPTSTPTTSTSSNGS